MKTYKLRIKKAMLIKGDKGNNIQISMIKLVDENDKYIKFIKILQWTIKANQNPEKISPIDRVNF